MTEISLVHHTELLLDSIIRLYDCIQPIKYKNIT